MRYGNRGWRPDTNFHQSVLKLRLHHNNVLIVSSKNYRRRCSKSHPPEHGGLGRGHVPVQPDVSTIRVIYSRKASAPNNNDKTDFEKFLTGTTYNKNKNIHGFYKYSPADNNNRNPSSGFATISKLHFYSKYGISEVHDGTDKWINMWHSAQSSNNFVTSDDRLARGTKCIAGYCCLNKPIWVMVR